MGIAVATAQAALRTTTGQQTISLPSGFGTVKAYLAFVGRGITDGTAADNAAWSVGASDGSTESLANIFCEHNVGTTNTLRNMETTEVLQVLKNDGEVAVEADSETGGTPFDAADEFTINVGATDGSAPRAKFLALGGSDLSVFVGTGTLTASQDSTQGFTGIGFEPDQIFFWTTTAGTGPPASTTSAISFGWASNDAPLVQHALAALGVPAVGTSANVVIHGRNRCIYSLSSISISRAAEFDSFDTDGFTLRKRDGTFNIEFHFLAVNYGGAVNFKGNSDITPPTSTGDDAQTWPGFTPQCVMLNLGALQSVNAIDVSGIEPVTFAVGVFDAAAEWCIGYSDEDEADTTNTQSLANNSAVDLVYVSLSVCVSQSVFLLLSVDVSVSLSFF